MSQITILKKTSKSSGELYEMVNRYIIRAADFIDDSINIVSYSWNRHKNRLEFTLNHQWQGVKGEIVIVRSDLIVIVRIPLVLHRHKKIIKGKIDLFADHIVSGSLDIEEAAKRFEKVCLTC